MRKEAEFFNVEGIPVTIGSYKGAPYCARWDEPVPRVFNPDSARRNGTPMLEEPFLDLVEKLLFKRSREAQLRRTK